jgi:acyl carrier protein
MISDHIHERIRQHIFENFIFEEGATLSDDQSLLKSGVVDSTGILELIAFAEEEFDIKFADNELVADNFDTVHKITAFLESKASQKIEP